MAAVIAGGLQDGEVSMRIKQILSDLCGWSVAGPFEVSLNGTAAQQALLCARW